MAAATTIIAATAAAGGLAKSVSGAAQTRKAQNAIDSYERQELDNAFEDMQISTLGSDLIKEEGQRTTATLVDAARSGGVRSIMSAIPKIVSLNNDTNAEAMKVLDDQVIRRNYAIAQDDARIREMQERREEGDLAGLGMELNAGRQNMWSGISDVANAGMMFANSYSATPNPQANSVIDEGLINQISGTQSLSGGAKITSSLPNKLNLNTYGG